MNSAVCAAPGGPGPRNRDAGAAAAESAQFKNVASLSQAGQSQLALDGEVTGITSGAATAAAATGPH